MYMCGHKEANYTKVALAMTCPLSKPGFRQSLRSRDTQARSLMGKPDRPQGYGPRPSSHIVNQSHLQGNPTLAS